MGMAYRVGYAIAKTALAVAIFTLPHSLHHNEPPGTLVVITITLCSAAFVILQGSDPGYLTDELLGKAIDAEEEEGQLLTTEEEEDDDGEDGMELRSPGKNREKSYRIKRIQQIKAALQKMDTSGEESKKDEEDDSSPVMQTVDLEAQTRGDDIESFCPDCSIFPPLRSRHCRMCGKCVATFDHHCFLLGTCIGEKNHSRFWWYLLFQTVELTLGLLVITARFQPPQSKSTWMQVNGWAIFLLGILALLLIFVASMLGFHTFLAMGSMTTYEFGHSGSDKLPYLRGFRECDLPFSRGLWRNLAFFCCPQRPLLSWFLSSPPPSSSSSAQPPAKHHTHSDAAWRPMLWRAPVQVDRDSDKICDNIWENKYYSCC